MKSSRAWDWGGVWYIRCFLRHRVVVDREM